MAESEGFKLFGFEIKRARDRAAEKRQSIVPPVDQDGAGYVSAAGAHYGTYVNLGEGDQAKDNLNNIRQYRAVATHPEVDAAIEDIVNEGITAAENESPVSLVLDHVEGLSDQLKKAMTDEFENICSMLQFTELGHDIFRRWYIDGRIYHHLVVDENNLKAGIQEIRPIDATKIRKVKEVKKKKDPVTGATLIENVNEFYIYQEKPGGTNQGIKISNDSVSYVTSGLLDVTGKKVVSNIHKALKPINQLRMMEDSLVIYRLARAPERRIFYIDVGNLPRGKAETYMKDIMSRYRNKLVYDADTGKIRDDRKHMSMLEDFWLPRKEGGRGTEITTLPGGENLGQIDDIIYFQKRLYRSLNVPINRLEQEAQFSLGRSTEINRDEIKFQKFIDRLRKRFSMLFTEILKKQLIMKGVIVEEDWKEWQGDIVIDYVRDNHFTELKDTELLQNRLQTLDNMQQYVGEFFSKEWVMKNVLMMDDDDMKQMKDQISQETKDGDIEGDEPEEREQPQSNGADNGQRHSIDINVNGANNGN
tara:strand:- start:2734 stop:4329 length:1596 start_codon:yes stop_codon:yes gene_type:complete